MFTIFVLFVGLTLATAVIAYWSDNLGKKLGKKRVSLWGMRPRTTATFLTIASSWLIMIFTLGVMLTLFPLLRRSLLHYDEVRKTATQLDAQVKTLKTNFSQASDELGNVTAKLKTSTQAAKEARKEQQEARKQANEARKSAAGFRESQKEAVQREKEARANLKTVKSQRDATEQERKDAQQKLDVAQDNLKRASEKVKAADNRVTAADNRVIVANNKVAQAENKVVEAQKKLNGVTKSLDAARKNEGIANGKAKAAQASADDAIGKRDKANKDYKTANRDYILALDASEKAKAELRETQGKVDQLEQQRQGLLDVNARLFEENRLVGSERDIVLGNEILVPVGYTLVARTFEQGVSFLDAERQLHAIFDTAKEVIAPGPNKPALLPGAELRLATQQEIEPKLNESDPDVLVVLDEEGIYNSLADAISHSQTPLSVRLVSNINHLEGQRFLYTRFTLVPVRPALRAGVELASMTFNENLSDARLFSALSKLVEAGRRVASQNGVRPPLTPDNPESPDSPDSRDFYAPGSNERMFETLRKVSAQGGRARVSLVTDKAISTIDQLSVRFEVESLAPDVSAPRATVAASQSRS